MLLFAHRAVNLSFAWWLWRKAPSPRARAGKDPIERSAGRPPGSAAEGPGEPNPPRDGTPEDLGAIREILASRGLPVAEPGLANQRFILARDGASLLSPEELYLPHNTAEEFFAREGHRRIDRDLAPRCAPARSSVPSARHGRVHAEKALRLLAVRTSPSRPRPGSLRAPAAFALAISP